jgi:uncharacterized protein YjiS (DUF1127 family)
MTMLFDPMPRTLSAVRHNHVRAAAGAIRHTGARTIEAIGRLCHAFVVKLMRRHMRLTLHSMNDRLLARSGIRRSEIDALVAKLIPHRD